MNDLERNILAVALAIAYAIVWVAVAVAVFRIGVAGLWGSGSDLGLVAAVALAAGAVIGLGWLAVLMLRDLAKRFPPGDDSMTFPRPKPIPASKFRGVAFTLGVGALIAAVLLGLTSLRQDGGARQRRGEDPHAGHLGRRRSRAAALGLALQGDRRADRRVPGDPADLFLHPRAR